MPAISRTIAVTQRKGLDDAEERRIRMSSFLSEEGQNSHGIVIQSHYMTISERNEAQNTPMEVPMTVVLSRRIRQDIAARASLTSHFLEHMSKIIEKPALFPTFYPQRRQARSRRDDFAPSCAKFNSARWMCRSAHHYTAACPGDDISL